MSRFNPHHQTQLLYEAVDAWRTRCLIGDGSILSDTEGLWTTNYLAELNSNFVENLQGGDRDFFTKLQEQLGVGSSQSKMLMAEILWLILLFPTNPKAPNKRSNIIKVWGWSNEPLDETQASLSDAVLEGIGSAGQAFNTGRWRELNFLITAMADFKARSLRERTQIANDPWAFCDWLDSCDGASRRQLRHILPHILFPDTFERISFAGDKQKIVAAFSKTLAGGVPALSHKELDEELLSIRRSHETTSNAEIDFYGDELKSTWKPDNRSDAVVGAKSSKVWIEKTIVAGRPDRMEGQHALGKALWSPIRSKSGTDIYANMRQVTPGDTILHLTDNLGFSGVSIVAGSADESFQGIQGTAWVGPCYRVPLKDFTALDPVLGRSAFLETPPFAEQLRALAQTTKGLFYNSNLELNQGAYLTLAPPELVDVLQKAYFRATGQALPITEGALNNEPNDKVIDTEPERAPMTYPVYTVNDIINDGCFIEQKRIDYILARLKSKKNIILQGPPGTGKTWLARRLGFALIGYKDPTRISMVQFHPNLSYEDFVRGYRPTSEGKLALTDGILMEAIERAKETDLPYVVVIEEINRGNPAQILGEMLTLLEADKRQESDALELSYRRTQMERVHIPSNLHVIGTMNVADRSLAIMDLALRRRFAYIDLEPSIGGAWKSWIRAKHSVPPAVLDEIERRIAQLNTKLTKEFGRQFCIGHSFVTPPETESVKDFAAWFNDVVETELKPLLEEYWFESPKMASDAAAELTAPL